MSVCAELEEELRIRTWGRGNQNSGNYKGSTYYNLPHCTADQKDRKTLPKARSGSKTKLPFPSKNDLTSDLFFLKIFLQIVTADVFQNL